MSPRVPGARGAAALGALLLALGPVLAPPPRARADDLGAPHVRVLVGEADVRAEPAGAARVVGRVHRGDVLRLEGRAARGAWLHVRLPDGRTAWLADAEGHVFLAPPDAGDLPRAGLLATPPLAGGRVELAVAVGVLGERFGLVDGGPFGALRLAVLFVPALGLEATVGAVAGAEGQLGLASLGLVLNVPTGGPFVPFAALGGGWAWGVAREDAPLRADGSAPTAHAGGGVRLAFRGGVVLRLEVRAHALFEEARPRFEEELSGGVGVFF